MVDRRISVDMNHQVGTQQEETTIHSGHVSTKLDLQQHEEDEESIMKIKKINLPVDSK